MKKTFIIALFSIFLSVFLFGCKVATPTVEITLTSELNTVSYSLKFSDIDEDRSYKVELSNTEKTVAEKVNTVKNNTGKFENLEYNRDYFVTVYVGEKANSKEYTKKLGESKISTNILKFENVKLEGQTFTYDGTAKSISVTGAPEGTNIEYTGNGVTEVGEHTVSAKLTKEGYEDLTLTAKIVIVKSTVDFTIENVETVYSGQPVSVEVETELELTYEYYLGETKLESAPVNAGTYTVKAIYAGNAGVEGLTKSATLTIKKADTTITAANVTKVYDGTAAAVTATVSNGATPVVKYYNGTTELTEAPVAVGEYTAKVTYAGNENYNAAADVTVTITITKAAAAELTIANKEVTYNGEAQTITATTSLTVTYEYYNGTTKLNAAPVNAGTYTVKAIYAGDANHEAKTVEATLTIKKADVTITAANVTKVYDGTAATVTATVSNGGTAVIAYPNETAPVNAGTYTVTVSYAGNENYNAAADVTVTITIAKADVTITAADVTKVYDGTAATVTATVSNGGTAVIAYPNETAPVNAGTYTVTVTYAGNENYNAAANVTVTITIAKATVEFELADIETTYGQTYEVEVDTELPVTYEYYNGTTKLEAKPVNAGTYTVKAIYAGDANHEGLTVEAELVIEKADTTITAPANVSKEYDEEAAVVTATVSNGATPVITYNTTDGKAPVSVGAYTATVSYAGNENYNAAETVTVTITITRPGYATLTIALEDITVTFGETYEVEGTVTGSDKVTFEDLTFVFKDSEGNVVTTPVNAGTYSIVASYEVNDDLFINAAVAQATLIINQVEVTFELEGNTEVTYDGNAHELTVDTEYDVTIEYYLDGNKVTEVINAGTYTVKAIYAGDDNHAAKTVEATLVIKQAEVTLTVSETDIAITYGETYTITATVSNDDNETIVIEYYKGTTKLEAAPTDAGSYTAKVLYSYGNYAATPVTVTITIAAKVELVMRGVQIRGKDFDPGILAIQITSGENNVKYVDSFEVLDSIVDTTGENLVVNVKYDGKEYLFNGKTVEKSPLMIYAVYGAGGNDNATYTYDFIILYNSSSEDISLSGYTLQYFSKKGNNSGKTDLTKTIKAFGFYTIQCGTNDATVGSALPFTADQKWNVNYSGSDFQIILVPSKTTMASLANNNVIDCVGAGGGANKEGEAAVAGNTTQYLKRKEFADTNNNKADFEIVSLTTETFDFLEPGYVVNAEFIKFIDNLTEENDFSAITAETITLPVIMLGGIVISWETSDEDVISINPTTGVATIVRPQEELGETDATVTLVAKVNMGGVELTEQIVVLVKAIPANRDAAILEAAGNIIAESIDTTQNIKENFNLPTLTGEDYEGVSIVWSSNDEYLVKIVEGVAQVTRPRNIDGTTAVVLTATLSKGEADPVVITITINVECIEVATHAEYIEAASGTKNVTVQGVVTGVNSKTVYIQDKDGAYCLVFSSSQSSQSWAVIGTEIKVTGDKNLNYGLQCLNVTDSVEIISTGNDVIPVDKTEEFAEKGFTTLAKVDEQRLVVFEGVVSAEKIVKVGEKSINVYWYNNSQPKYWIEGIKVEVTGLLYLYSSGPTYQVCIYSPTYVKCLATDAEKVAKDKELLEVVENVTTSLELEFEGACGSIITWESNSSVIAVDNNAKEVTVEPADTDTTVELTATISLNEVTETRTFTVTVAAKVDRPIGQTNKLDLSSLSNSTSYTNRTLSGGWTAVNAAVAIGGTSNSTSKPSFINLGTEKDKALILNGKTTAVGKITSPTLTNGITKISFSYLNGYSEGNGVDLQINIKSTSGTVLATKQIDNNNVQQYNVYSYEWELETAIQGNIIVEIVNNSPSNSTSNKDRVCIFNITWVTYN